MRLPNDDEIYQVDQTYLGPPGRYLGRLRHKALLIGPILFFVSLAFMVRIGIDPGFASVGVLFLLTRRGTNEIIRKMSGGRTIKSMLMSMVHEIGAPRAPKAGVHVQMPKLNRRRTKITTGYASRQGRRFRWHMRGE
jgi:hypothetical protein